MANGTNVPPITFNTGTGFQAPTGPAILAGVQADINAAFGSTLNFALSTPQGQLSASEAAVIANVYAVLVYYSQQTDPAFASGREQDAIARIYFLERNPAEPTALTLQCNGLPGVPIPVGALVVDASGNLYSCIQSGSIGGGGSINLAFACTIPGPTPVPPTVAIYQSIQGWDSATVVSGAAGSNDETRAALEVRRADSVAGNSLGAIGSIIGQVAQVSGVLDYFGYNNNTANPVTTGGVTIPAYAIYICVAGGSPNDVAQAILSRKGPGAPMTGNTTVTAFDNNPLYVAPIPYQITFQIPMPLEVLFSVQIVNSTSVPGDFITQVQNQIVLAAEGQLSFNNPPPPPKARIGSTIYGNAYIPAISALGSWAQVASINVGSANTAGASVVGKISGTTLSITQILSGTVAVGQFLSDGSGASGSGVNLIVNGSQIAAFVSGSAGGTGTYTVNQSQTIGATVTTASGTGLIMTTGSGVIGIIAPNMLLSNGTGVSANTIVLSQLSGSAGGSGTYLLNQAIHLPSPTSITVNDIITLSSANQTRVIVQINQIPLVSAPNISVSLTP